MQTRAAKRKRVVLGELPKSPKCIKNPNVKKSSAKKKKPLCKVKNELDSYADPVTNPNVKKSLKHKKPLSTVKEELDSYDDPITNPNFFKSLFTVKEEIDCNAYSIPITNGKSDAPLVSDFYTCLRKMEAERKRRPMIDYMERVQHDITEEMRGLLVDWLVQIADWYKLLPETLYLSVSYIDRFLSHINVVRTELQLLGVSSLLIAAKYEEVTLPHVEELCTITDNTYIREEVLRMEADILKFLNFEMGNPTVKTFLRRLTGIAGGNDYASSLQVEFLSCYLAELSLLEYDCIGFLPSLVAASAIFLSRFIIWPEEETWSSELQECSRYTPAALKDCVLILHDLYLTRRGVSHQAIWNKYKEHKFKYVANLPTVPHLPDYLFEED